MNQFETCIAIRETTADITDKKARNLSIMSVARDQDPFGNSKKRIPYSSRGCHNGICVKICNTGVQKYAEVTITGGNMDYLDNPIIDISNAPDFKNLREDETTIKKYVKSHREEIAIFTYMDREFRSEGRSLMDLMFSPDSPYKETGSTNAYETLFGKGYEKMSDSERKEAFKKKYIDSYLNK